MNTRQVIMLVESRIALQSELRKVSLKDADEVRLKSADDKLDELKNIRRLILSADSKSASAKETAEQNGEVADAKPRKTGRKKTAAKAESAHD